MGQSPSRTGQKLSEVCFFCSEWVVVYDAWNQRLTSSRPSSSWNVRDKNKHVNLSSFLVKRMKSFPIRMEPLKKTRIFMYKKNKISRYVQLIGLWEKCHNTYDFNPFPYWPMWVDSGNRLLDLPNWMTCVASPIQNTSTVITVSCMRCCWVEMHAFCGMNGSVFFALLTGVHSSAIVKKTQHKPASQIRSLLWLAITNEY